MNAWRARRAALRSPRLRRPRALPTWEEAFAVVTVMALLAGLGVVLHDRWQRLTAPPVVAMRAPAPGTRTLTSPMDLILAIDDSTSTQDSDPHRYRSTEGALVVDWYALHSGDPDDRLAAARFTTEVLDQVPATTAAEAAGPVGALLDRARGEAGSTDITAAAEWIREQCTRSGDRRSVVVLFTDGATDPDAGGGFDGLAEDLRTIGCDAVWLVALASGDVYASVEGFWDEQPLAGRIRMETVRPGSVARAIAGIVLAETGQQADGDLVTVR